MGYKWVFRYAGRLSNTWSEEKDRVGEDTILTGDPGGGIRSSWAWLSEPRIVRSRKRVRLRSQRDLLLGEIAILLNSIQHRFTVG